MTAMAKVSIGSNPPLPNIVEPKEKQHILKSKLKKKKLFQSLYVSDLFAVVISSLKKLRANVRLQLGAPP